MTSFNRPAPGTESSVPEAGAPQPNPAQVTALQSVWAAMNTFAQAQGPPRPVTATPVADAETCRAPDPRPLCSPPTTAFRTGGPWVVGSLYHVVPAAPLMPIAEEDNSECLWYAITRGLYVGITLNNPLTLAAVLGISGSAMKGHKTQAKALAVFNKLLAFNMVRVIQ
ncbi:hypothetical protein B0H13DRAFT_1879462 [Mycena leptocephala]|nr:hypothetical protein B0H13DRAFT_1879462 [Mycena leptocephala]